MAAGLLAIVRAVAAAFSYLTVVFVVTALIVTHNNADLDAFDRPSTYGSVIAVFVCGLPAMRMASETAWLKRTVAAWATAAVFWWASRTYAIERVGKNEPHPGSPSSYVGADGVEYLEFNAMPRLSALGGYTFSCTILLVLATPIIVLALRSIASRKEAAAALRELHVKDS